MLILTKRASKRMMMICNLVVGLIENRRIFAVSNRDDIKVRSLKKNPDVYFFVDIADRGVSIGGGTGADSDIGRSLGRYIILYHDLKVDFVHKLCPYICMLFYSDLKKMVFDHYDNVNSRNRTMFLYKNLVYSIIKMSYKQFSASRCAASLLLIITTGKQQLPPPPQLIHQHYYFLQKDEREGQEHEKEEEVGIH
jgi:hypothetical protein